MAVIDELARGEDRRHELGTVHHRIEALLEQPDQQLAGVAAAALRHGIDTAELLFGQVAVMALQLLLGAQLQAEIRHLALAPLAVLTGGVVAAVHRGFGPAPNILAHAAVDLVLGGGALGHVRSPLGSLWMAPPLPSRGDRIPLARATGAGCRHPNGWHGSVTTFARGCQLSALTRLLPQGGAGGWQGRRATADHRLRDRAWMCPEPTAQDRR